MASYRASFLSARGVAIATARAGNVVGGGDWSEDRLIPGVLGREIWVMPRRKLGAAAEASRSRDS